MQGITTRSNSKYLKSAIFTGTLREVPPIEGQTKKVKGQARLERKRERNKTK